MKNGNQPKKRGLLKAALALTLLLSSCTQWKKGKPPGEWYESYQPIQNPQADLFVKQAISLTTTQFPDSIFPIKKIILRHSKKTTAAKNYRIAEHFSLTECIDSTNGIFVIYIEVDPTHPSFYPLLGHECTHLINPKIFDWYMEGIATQFSEDLCKKEGKSWAEWTKRFNKNSTDPYALSYQMMHQIKQTVSPQTYAAILRYRAPNHFSPSRERIDIIAWLKTLSPKEQTKVISIIRRYEKQLLAHKSKQYDFTKISNSDLTHQSEKD